MESGEIQFLDGEGIAARAGEDRKSDKTLWRPVQSLRIAPSYDEHHGPVTRVDTSLC